MSLKCALCGEYIDEGEDTFQTLKGEVACISCYEEAWGQSSTVIRFSPGGEKEATSFTEQFGSLEGGDTPEPIENEIWVKIDRWRGYSDWKITKGYKKIADGWITGFPDSSVQRKIDLHEIFSDLQDGKITPPCDMFWVFGRTSNVFSSACVVVVRKDDVEEIEKWLNEIDGGVEGLNEMLS
jgi:hypothetical protein